MGAPELCVLVSRRVCLYTVALASARRSAFRGRTFTPATPLLGQMSSANSIQAVHLRRALLLFAIVLGTAALVASLSRPVEDRRERERPADPGPPTATPTPSSRPERPVSFEAAKDESRRLRAGEAATLEVTVTEPGNVQIPELGLSAPAAPLTPARFEVLPAEPGDYEIEFTAAGAQTEPGGKMGGTSAG